MQANKISLMTFTVKEQSAINKWESEDKKCVRSYTSHQALLRMNGHNGWILPYGAILRDWNELFSIYLDVIAPSTRLVSRGVLILFS